mmetsp:Transcript_4260/g.6710  ORF Transcript_4260/g.6710 Transcript_4260/m.6710 type:complete len:111 (+) Transcript_4260:518-850(+)
MLNILKFFSLLVLSSSAVLSSIVFHFSLSLDGGGNLQCLSLSLVIFACSHSDRSSGLFELCIKSRQNMKKQEEEKKKMCIYVYIFVTPFFSEFFPSGLGLVRSGSQSHLL